MRLYLAVRGEWAGVFSVWVPHEDLVYVWISDLPRCIDEGRELEMAYTDFHGYIARDSGRIVSVDLDREEFLVGIRPRAGLLVEDGGPS